MGELKYRLYLYLHREAQLLVFCGHCGYYPEQTMDLERVTAILSLTDTGT